jgi:hypothetical protein
MYTNGNLEAHLAALLFLGCTALIFFLLIAAAILFFVRRRWAPYPLLAIGVVVMGYGLLLAAFSYTSYDRTAARGDEKYFCEMDCHIAYSVLNVEHTKFIRDATAHGEFVIITLRSHFDERTIAPWRGDAPLRPDPVLLQLIDANGRSYSVSTNGQEAWDTTHQQPHSLRDLLRPGESFKTTWIFDVPPDAQSMRLLTEVRGFPTYLLIGDETTPRHGKTYLAL